MKNPMISRIKSPRLKSERYPMDGMMNSSILDMIINLILSSRINKSIRFRSLSPNQKIKIGGGLSEISSMRPTFVSLMSSSISLIELEAVKWLPRPLPLLLMRLSITMMILSLCMLTLLPKEISCLPNGNK
jgi:hypothetical protein